MTDVGREIYEELRQAGLSPAQAAGVLGNTQQESSNNPRDAGGGLFQGIGGRARLGEGDARQQVKTALSEEPNVWKAIRHARTPEEAARIFSQQFERPGTPMLGNRERYAREALSRYGHITPGPTVPGAAAPLVPEEGSQPAGPPPENPIDAIRALKTGPMDPQIEKNWTLLKNLFTPASPINGPPTGEPPALQSAETKQLPVEKIKGVTDFGGMKVAGWIAPILQWAQQHGWKGGVTSGYRSYAEQKRIYDSGVRPAAVPGTSNHEGTEFPRGAVDVSNAEELSKILQHSPYAHALIWAGSKDPVHFSHPHNGSY